MALPSRGRARVYLNGQPWRPAMRDAVTIPQHFRKHGYAVRGSGKIYHGAYPDPPSWDDFYPSKRQQKPPDPKPPRKPMNGLKRTAHFDWGPLDVDDAAMGDAKVAEWVAARLREIRSQAAA